MIFNYLTRRFAEDELLSEKVLSFTKQLSKLFAREAIDLSVLVSRGVLNSVLEAGLQKHINTPQVVHFASTMISQLPVRVNKSSQSLICRVCAHLSNSFLMQESCFK
jgi:nucleolar pre-ribosomal-associated protein 1